VKSTSDPAVPIIRRPNIAIPGLSHWVQAGGCVERNAKYAAQNREMANGKGAAEASTTFQILQCGRGRPITHANTIGARKSPAIAKKIMNSAKRPPLP